MACDDCHRRFGLYRVLGFLDGRFRIVGWRHFLVCEFTPISIHQIHAQRNDAQTAVTNGDDVFLETSDLRDRDDGRGVIDKHVRGDDLCRDHPLLCDTVCGFAGNHEKTSEGGTKMTPRPFWSLSPQVVSSLIVIAVLSLIFILVGNRIGKLKPSETPKGFTFALLMFSGVLIDMMRPFMKGKRLNMFGPYLLSIFMFLATANTIALFGLAPPLSNIGVALSFSIITLFLLRFADLHFIGLKRKLRNLVGQVWQLFILFIPINLIGEFSTPLTMGIRLFGNLVSGAVISALVFAVTTAMAGVFEATLVGIGVSGILSAGIGLFIHAIFDLFFGLIQAFVFFMLSMVNISMASDN